MKRSLSANRSNRFAIVRENRDIAGLPIGFVIPSQSNDRIIPERGTSRLLHLARSVRRARNVQRTTYRCIGVSLGQHSEIGNRAANRGARRCRLYLLISLERMCEKRGIRDKGIVKWGRRTSRTDEIKERGGRRWTVTDGNTSSPSWLPSYRRTYGQTAKTRQTGSRKHVLRTTGPFVIPEAFCSARVHLSLSVGRCFACVDAVVSFRFLARTTSRPGSSLRVGFIPLGSASRQQQRSAVAAGPLGGLQTSRIRQIQLTRAELNRRNPLTVRSSLARSEYSALPFSFDRLSHLPSVCPSNPTFSLVLRPTLEYARPSSSLCFHHPRFSWRSFETRN